MPSAWGTGGRIATLKNPTHILFSRIAALCYTASMKLDDSPPNYPWLAAIQARGLAPALRTTLDVIEPLGPLVAQVLWVAQPAFGLFGSRRMIHDIATALEEPGGLEQLRRMLDEDPAEDDASDTS